MEAKGLLYMIYMFIHMFEFKINIEAWWILILTFELSFIHRFSMFLSMQQIPTESKCWNVIS